MARSIGTFVTAIRVLVINCEELFIESCISNVNLS